MLVAGVCESAPRLISFFFFFSGGGIRADGLYDYPAQVSSDLIIFIVDSLWPLR
jgi:hypothetical protein